MNERLKQACKVLEEIYFEDCEAYDNGTITASYKGQGYVFNDSSIIDTICNMKTIDDEFDFMRQIRAYAADV